MGRTPRNRLVRVVLKEPRDGRTEFYFGSFKAIFERFSPEDVGTTLYYIYHYGQMISADKPLVTERATISYVHFERAKQQRTT